MEIIFSTDGQSKKILLLLNYCCQGNIVRTVGFPFRLRRLLVSMGDRFSADEVEDMFKGADSCLYEDGLDYEAFVKIIKNGEEREDE